MAVVRCKAPRKKDPSARCDGFVAMHPDDDPHVFLGIVRHSQQARPGNYVWPCIVCGKLHEFHRIARAPHAPEAA